MIKKVFFIAFICFTFLWGNAPKKYVNSPNPEYKTDRILAKFSSKTIKQFENKLLLKKTNIIQLDSFLNKLGVKSIAKTYKSFEKVDKKYEFDNWYTLHFDKQQNIRQIKNELEKSSYILQTEYEYLLYLQTTPNDTYYAQNWGHNNTGQFRAWESTSGSHTGSFVGTAGFDTNASQAWDYAQGYGLSSVIIAIIDSGVDTTHPDLNTVTGYDFGDNDNNPNDDSNNANVAGHGTSCAGIAAAVTNNNLGVAGVAGNCRIMPLKVANSAGEIYSTSVINSINYASSNTANIISMSFGGASYSQSFQNAITNAYNNGLTMFAATGNNNGSEIHYPAAYEYVIGVGAAAPCGSRKRSSSSSDEVNPGNSTDPLGVTCDNEIWWGSNYGSSVQNANDAVDIIAPTILPTTDITGTAGYSSGDYSMYFNGTSCATPYAAGVGALALSNTVTLTPSELRTLLRNTATDVVNDESVSGWDRYSGYGLVNAGQALSQLSQNEMPVCSIVEPENNMYFVLGDDIPVTAEAFDNNGNIQSVKFYVNNELVHTEYYAPYNAVVQTNGLYAGNHMLKAVATDNDGNVSQSFIIFKLVTPATEDFETGDFSSFNWQHSGNADWQITNNAAVGSYAIKSGEISDNQTSAVSLNLSLINSGEISFFVKTSSEENNDELTFYIDDQEIGTWSGLLSWQQVSFNVESGSHTFKWEYSKNASGLTATDEVYIDHIILPEYSRQTPEISLNTTVLNFGTIAVNSTEERFLVIKNIGQQSLAGSISVDLPFTIEAVSSRRTRTSLNYNLAFADSVIYSISYNPTEIANHNSVINVYSNDPNTPHVSVNVVASSVAANQVPNIAVNPGSFSISQQQHVATCQTLAIENTGVQTLNYTATVDYTTNTRALMLNESFENGLPSTWNNQVVSGSGVWQSSTSYAKTGSKCAYASYSSITSSRLVTEEFEVNGDCTLSFWQYTHWANDGGDFAVEIKKRNGPWIVLDSYSTNNMAYRSYEQKTYNLNEYMNEAVQIGFRYYNNNNGNGIRIDDVQVNIEPLETDWCKINSENSYVSSVNQEPEYLNIGIDTANMEVGTYNCTIVISSNDPDQAVINIPVSLQVTSNTPVTHYFWNLDTNPNWYSNGNWNFGNPTGQGGDHGSPDPNSAYTGQNVYGNNLNGDYTEMQSQHELITNSFNCQGITGTKLRFWRWLGVEGNEYDNAGIYVSTDSLNWNQVWANPGNATEDDSWNQIEYDISEYADGQENVYVKWTIGPTDSSWFYCGWNIDDIEIVGYGALHLTTPENISVEVINETIYISCDTVENASSYRVYFGTSPDGDFVRVSNGISEFSFSQGRVTWQKNLGSNTKGFYVIKACTTDFSNE